MTSRPGPRLVWLRKIGGGVAHRLSWHTLCHVEVYGMNRQQARRHALESKHGQTTKLPAFRTLPHGRKCYDVAWW